MKFFNRFIVPVLTLLLTVAMTLLGYGQFCLQRQSNKHEEELRQRELRVESLEEDLRNHELREKAIEQQSQDLRTQFAKMLEESDHDTNLKATIAWNMAVIKTREIAVQGDRAEELWNKAADRAKIESKKRKSFSWGD